MEAAVWQAVYRRAGGAVPNHKSKSIPQPTPFGACTHKLSLFIEHAHGTPQSLQSPQSLPPPHHMLSQAPFINDFNAPHSHHHIQKPNLPRGSSETAFLTSSTPKPIAQPIPRTSSDVIQHPKPLPLGQFQSAGRSRVQWNLGSEG